MCCQSTPMGHVTPNVKAQGRGQKRPTGTALKLLRLVQKRGLEVVTS